MTRRRDPSCPSEGMPCRLVLDDLLIEMARVNAREEGRPPEPCRRCSEGNRIALGGSSLCYRCMLRRDVELDHPPGSGSGPAVLPIDSNAHRIANESERIWRNIVRQGLCDGCLAGYPMRLGIMLARLEIAS